MELLAHRGYWSNGIPGNSPEALKRALECGYGIESDVRDYDGTLVISHYVAEKRCSAGWQSIKTSDALPSISRRTV